MITVKQKNFTPYDSIDDNEKHIIVYPKLFTESNTDLIIDELLTHRAKTTLCLTGGLLLLTDRFFSGTYNSKGILAVIVTENAEFTAENKSDNEKIKIKCSKGSVLILGEEFRSDWNYDLPYSVIIMYERNKLPNIYRNIESRIAYSKKIQDALKHIGNLPEWKQNIQKHLYLTFIGEGSYANVFRGRFMNNPYAVKISKIKEEMKGKPFSVDLSSWHEVFILRDIIRPIIEKKICPNLPLLIDSFTCDECELFISEKKLDTPAIITVVELADGNLRKYIQKPRDIEENRAILFQVMAGLHAIQYHAQIMNFDVKKENVLYYNIEPGGYWCYRIHGKDYYVPNYGKLFVLNDFGISRSMSPRYPMYKTAEDKTFRLGSRYAVVKDGKFVPFNVVKQVDAFGEIVPSTHVKWFGKINNASKGAEFRINKSNDRVYPLEVIFPEGITEYLASKNVTTNTSSKHFFTKPEIIPPFEFYNDTQDAIRMFTGGKRTTQKGNHKAYPGVPKKFIKELEKYVGKSESAKDYAFSYNPAEVLAGYFIEDFFHTFREKPNGEILESYVIS